jgi:hypothetical protein
MPDKKKLASGLKSVRSKQGYFAMIAHGNGGALLVGKKPIAKSDIETELEQLKGGTIYKGVCGPSNGGVLFECDKDPPGTLAATIKTLAKSQGGVSINVQTQKQVKKDVDDVNSPIAKLKTDKKAPQQIDKPLLKGLMRAKTGNVNFAVVIKDSKEGMLFVSKRKVAPAEITFAKKATGGTKVFRGTVHSEGSTFVCELLTKPPASLAKAIKNYAKLQTGKLIKVKCVQVKEIADIDEKEGEDTGPQVTLAPLKAEAIAWTSYRSKALLDLGNLERAVRLLATDQANNQKAETLEAADILLKLRNDFPDPLGGPLAGLDHAATSNDENNYVTSRGLALKGVKAMKTFLSQNREVIKQVQKNKLGVKIDLLKDADTVLQGIVTALA